jgi:hypothetical protein
MSTALFVGILSITFWWTNDDITAKPDRIVWIGLFLALAMVTDITVAIRNVRYAIENLHSSTEEQNRSLGTIIRILPTSRFK